MSMQKVLRTLGFSLQEVLVTLAIIGVAGAIATPAYQSMKERSKDKVAIAGQDTLYMAQQDFKRAAGDNASVLWAAATTNEAKFDLLAPYMEDELKSDLSQNSNENNNFSQKEYTYSFNGLDDKPSLTRASNGEVVGGTGTTTYRTLALTQNNLSGSEVAGLVKGAGQIADGTIINAIATPRNGFTFSYWSTTAGGTAVSTSQTMAITMDADKTFFANFTASAGGASGNYALVIKENIDEGGSVTGAGSYSSGSSQTIAATAATGYDFVRWEPSTSVASSTAASTTVTMNQNHTVTAIFAKETTTLSLSVNDTTMGSATGGGKYATGNTAVVTATANTPTYKFKEWTVGGTSYATTETASITMDADKTVVAVFEATPTVVLTVQAVLKDLTTATDAGRVVIDDETSTFSTGLANPATGNVQEGQTATVRAMTDTSQTDLIFWKYAKQNAADAVEIADPYSQNSEILVNGAHTVLAVWASPSDVGINPSTGSLDLNTLYSEFLVKPAFTFPTEGANVGQSATSLFSISDARIENSEETHASTDWQIASDSSFNTIEFESLNDTSNLTEIIVDTSAYTIGQTYYARARQKTSSLTSNYTDTLSFTITEETNPWGNSGDGSINLIEDDIGKIEMSLESSNDSYWLVKHFTNVTIGKNAILMLDYTGNKDSRARGAFYYISGNLTIESGGLWFVNWGDNSTNRSSILSGSSGSNYPMGRDPTELSNASTTWTISRNLGNTGLPTSSTNVIAGNNQPYETGLSIDNANTFSFVAPSSGSNVTGTSVTDGSGNYTITSANNGRTTTSSFTTHGYQHSISGGSTETWGGFHTIISVKGNISIDGQIISRGFNWVKTDASSNPTTTSNSLYGNWGLGGHIVLFYSGSDLNGNSANNVRTFNAELSGSAFDDYKDNKQAVIVLQIPE